MSSSWKKCSSCRSEIHFGATYWVCSVSTCQRTRMPLYFCTVGCWDAHLATANHREAWAEEKQAPSEAQWRAQAQAESSSPLMTPSALSRPEPTSAGATPPRQTVTATAPRRVVAPAAAANDDVPRDVLVVVSKLKKYIKARSGMKTSDTCTPVLSDFIRKLCDQAIQVATEKERKTVLDRDFDGLF